jgi:cytochrome c-type protein NapB
MKKLILNILTLIFSLLLAIPLTYAQDSPAQQTLRDNAALTELSPKPEIKRWEDSKPIERNYAKQPPVIPHTTKGYVINLKFNKCLTCHSDKNAPISGAPPVGKSHYSDRNTQLTTKISGRRYFCVQCHVPQMETELLVPNDFQLENGQ